MTSIERANTKPTLAQLITQMKPEIGRALPKHMSPDRMARIATTVLRQTPALARTTPESFLGALLTASQLGLEPGPTGEAYLVPYGNVCTFVPGYRGLIKLARNSGQLRDIWAEVVFERDTFRYTLGLHRDLIHEPATGDRGKPVAVYAAAQLVDGGTPFVVMTAADVEAIRARSKAGRNGPWVTDWAAMAKKTVVKQLAKWLPLSAEMTAAVTLDGAVRTEITELADVTATFIDGDVEPDTEPQPQPQPDIAPPAEVEAAPAPAPDVQMAGKPQLDKLKNIRAQEKYDTDEEWFAYVEAATGATVTADKQLTLEQADNLIALFNEDTEA